MKERLFEIWLSLRCGVANPAFIPLLKAYTPYELFSAGEDVINDLPCDDRLKRALCDKNLEESHRIQRYCQTNGIGIIFWQDDDYPLTLRVIPDPPMLLYCKGRLPDVNRKLCVGVVGTRSMSEYGKKMAYKIGYELSAVGAVVISGMALGVDAVAAAGAIAADGCTVAVLGCGIDVVYPVSHKTLMDEIVRHGAVLTEYPPATRPLRHHFPQRNRLISGLSQGVVVVEAGKNSGALLTAREAGVQGREIFAVPGNVGEPLTWGPNQLIAEGAGVVLKARDILDNYSFLYRDSLQMSYLPFAEMKSDPDDSVLRRLSVYVKVADAAEAPPTVWKKTTPNPEYTPPKAESYSKQRKNPPPSESKQTSPPPEPKRTPPSPEPKPKTPKSEPRTGDLSEKILLSLTNTQRQIFETLPLDHAVPVDYFVKSGFTMSEIMSAMTMLEIKGLVISLPGGLYSRK